MRRSGSAGFELDYYLKRMLTAYKTGMKVIGVAGLNGSGKDQVLKYLNKQYSIPFISVGDIVREVASLEGLALIRENLDMVTEKYFRLHGQGYFLKLVIDHIKRNQWNISGISGVRSPDDVALLREAFKHDFILIKVIVSDDRVRFNRMLARGSQRDNLTCEQFLEQDKSSESIFRIRETLQLADAAVSNDGTLEDLYNAIETLVRRQIFN